MAMVGKDKAVTGFVVEDFKPGMPVPRCMVIDMEMAQVLMDDLWNSGVRPTEGAGSAGSMRATEKHLEDMRAIAFSKLRIEVKP